MAFRVAIANVPISGRPGEPRVLQGSVSISAEASERPTCSLQSYWPEGATLAAGNDFILGDDEYFSLANDDPFLLDGAATRRPQSFDELTIDYPDLPYRPYAAELTSCLGYWTLDEAASTQAVDLTAANRRLDYGGSGVDFRDFDGASEAAVPYGGAPRFENTSGAGLTSAAVLPAVGVTFTLAGFVRLSSAGGGSRYVWRAGADSRSLRMMHTVGTTTASLELRLDGQTIGYSGVSVDEWHHMAVVRTPTAVELWVDGARVGSSAPTSGTATPLNGQTLTLAHAISGEGTEIGLDEWGLWEDALDISALNARRRHDRLFGGFVWGPNEEPWTGPVDSRNIGISGVGYGLRMDTRYVDRVIATPTGASIRTILSTILTEAGLTQFSLNGVLLSDTLDRVVYPYSSVSHILRDLATRVGAVVWVDPWREIQFRRRADVTRTDLVLDPTTVARISKKSTLRQFANQIVLIGAAQAGEAKDEFVGDGAKTVFDLTHQPTQLILVTVDGVPQTFSGSNPQWTLSVPNHTITATTAPAASKQIVVEYATADAIVVTEDNLSSQQDYGVVTRKIEDATADTVDLARSKARALCWSAMTRPP